MLKRLQFIPGINREATRYTATLGWYDADKVRFRNGRPEKIGGWRKASQESFKGLCRSLFDWSARDGTGYVGIGTNFKFYLEVGGEIQDITPIRNTTAAGDVTFSATDGSSTITVTDTSHGAVLYDFVTFSGAVSLGGTITDTVLNAEHQITEILTNDTYTIDVGVAANASDTGDGDTSVVGEYQINVGTNSFVGGTGWGLNAWGDGAFGSASTIGLVNQLRLYFQDAFEDDLLFNPRGGPIYYWDESLGTSFRAFNIDQLGSASDTPAACLQVMVSDVDRHVIAFGSSPLGSTAIDPLLIRWSDQEDVGNWTPTATNSAGGQVLSTGTLIIGAVKTRREIVVFTDTGMTSMRFSGSPFVFSFSVLAENVSIMSPKAAAVVGDAVYFMDREGFYIYRGAVERIPCPVYNYVFENLQLAQRYKVFAAVGQDDAEVTWFYPVGDDNADITNYVTYNYRENLWTIGTMARGAWIHAGTRNYPVASGLNLVDVNTNYLYDHEFGYDADGAELLPYIESGSVEIGDGDSLMFLRRLIADFAFHGNEMNAEITVTIKGKRFPLEDIRVLDDAVVVYNTKQNHIRARAREISIRIESTGTGYGWTAGDMRLDMRTDGRQ